MRRKGDLPELLAPAGDFECLVAAVSGGADAVYIGGKMFSARAYAKNFDLEEIKKAVSYCHLHGVRLYVTMNTLLFNNELGEAVEFARELYLAGVDAIIVADLGLIALLRERLPDFELHASTQMCVHNSIGADLAYDLGCSRVVLARELSGRNISDVTEKCKAETEVFLHGALCVCHSGQCLFSSMIGGRSGNRGECAQPCRLPYNDGKYILSLSDLSLAGHIGELIDSGVASLKIEGRMKSPDYVYTVTSIYRLLLDERRNATKSENVRLERIFSRGGFTDGYFTGKTFSSMTGIRTDEDKRNSVSEGQGEYPIQRTRVRAKVVMRLGIPSEMTLVDAYTGRSVSVIGAAPEAAKNSPLTEESVKDRLSKMGNTFLSLFVDDIELELDAGINLSPSLINKLRRDAAEKFEFFGRALHDEGLAEKHDKTDAPEAPKIERTAIFFKADVIDGLKGEAAKYFDVIFAPLFDYDWGDGVANGVYIPPVIMEDELPRVKEMLIKSHNLGAKYALIGNLSHVQPAKEAGLIPVGDFRLNVTNKPALETWSRLGVCNVVLSAELTAKQSAALSGIAVVYGRLPLMITERCFMKESFGCAQCGKCSLTDRMGVAFPILREFEHRNIIFNSAYTYMGDKPLETRGVGRHFIFTDESPADVESVIKAFKYESQFPLEGKFRRMGKRKFD